MKRIIRFALISAFAFGAMMITSCSKGDDGDGGGGTDDPITLTFDKTQYYPLDAVIVQLSKAAKAEQYAGIIGTQEVTAVRIEDSQLVIALPALPAGEYTLSLQMEKNTTVEGNLKIVALPVVENPEEVIEQMHDYYAGIITEAQETDDSNEELIAELAGMIEEQIAQLSNDERKLLAAWWQTHPEFSTDWEEFVRNAEAGVTRAPSSAASKMEKLMAYTVIWSATTTAFKASVVALFGSVATYTPTPWSNVAVGISLASTIATKMMSERYGKRALECTAFWDTSFLDIALTRSGYDFTVANGDSLSFNAEIRYRSVSAQDIGKAEAAEMVSTESNYTTAWGTLSRCVEKLRNFIAAVSPLSKPLPEISSITTPKTETEAFDGEIALQIVSGNVQVQKSGDNAFTFSATAEEDVEFTFKLSADEAESQVFTGLLEMEGTGPKITTTTLENGYTGEYYVVNLAADGEGEITWSFVGGSLPNGLTLDEYGYGQIYGEPEVPGDFTFTVKAANSEGEDTKELSIKILANAFEITTDYLANGNLGTAYSATLTSNSEEPVTWSIISGSLPGGLTLNSQTGVISGMPTTNESFDFRVMAENSTGASYKNLYITIKGEKPQIVTTSLPPGVTGTPYSYTLEAIGNGTLTWEGPFIGYLFLNSTTGILSGTPRNSGKSTIDVKVKNSNGEDRKTFEIDIDARIAGVWHVSKIEIIDETGNVKSEQDSFGTYGYSLIKGTSYQFTTDDTVYPVGQPDFGTTYSFSDDISKGILSFRHYSSSFSYEVTMTGENAMQLEEVYLFNTNKTVAYLTR